jgi:hypothetical protein
MATAEVALAAMACGAEVDVVHADGTRGTLRALELADMRPHEDASPYLVTAVRWPVPEKGVGVDVVELGEQGRWLPAVAIATVAHGTHARTAVALRDGARFVVEVDDPVEVVVTRATGSLPPSWIAAQVRASVDRARSAT